AVPVKAQVAAVAVDERTEEISITKLRNAMRPIVRRAFDFIRKMKRYEGGRHRARQIIGGGRNAWTRAMAVHIKAGAVGRGRKGGERKTAEYWAIPDFDRARALTVYEEDRRAVNEQFTKYKDRPRRAGKESS